ncbi:fasciculation and elongation protein zeta-2 isoform X2 [Bemisia tabaci]|uniref:fasciculation and elongation protein zeta-2 isoform X2 n=1 Tax=Bemisia tabaci TaxID=7038 RepID=UPI0008F9B26A|nr:PREDICTED: fasciculation and elongation protein zeta-2 isoform X2 [Bemisia tabaci]
MLDLNERMAELKFEAPLAQFEETEDWGADFRFKSANLDNFKQKQDEVKNINNLKNTSLQSPKRVCDNDNENDNAVQCELDNVKGDTTLPEASVSSVADNFTETFSGSLEDLVNTFDEKITKCFCNYDESVEKLAPVQVRTQEEIMSECQMWWTITGNFGNILPIDWSKSYTRKLQLSALNVNESEDKFIPDDLSSEDEAVASDLDMHSLILSGLTQDTEPPVKTAEEVIREIDDIMEESPECTPDSELCPDDLHQKGKEVLQSPLYQEKLKTLSVSQLNEVYLELELLIRDFSETLIAELALRDELEYEKELKNSFISLLLAVQNRRRQYHVDKKKGKNGIRAAGTEPKYLTTVIPYHLDSGPLDNQALQVLIKILKAINEDSPTVPTLLTDYILKVLCPT